MDAKFDNFLFCLHSFINKYKMNGTVVVPDFRLYHFVRKVCPSGFSTRKPPTEMGKLQNNRVGAKNNKKN